IPKTEERFLKGDQGHDYTIGFCLQMGPTKENDYCGQRAYHYGVYKRTQHGHQALLYGLRSLGLPMVHGGGTHAGLIGKYRSPYTYNDKAPESALNGRFKIEGFFKDKHQ